MKIFVRSVASQITIMMVFAHCIMPKTCRLDFTIAGRRTSNLSQWSLGSSISGRAHCQIRGHH